MNNTKSNRFFFFNIFFNGEIFPQPTKKKLLVSFVSLECKLWASFTSVKSVNENSNPATTLLGNCLQGQSPVVPTAKKTKDVTKQPVPIEIIEIIIPSLFSKQSSI